MFSAWISGLKEAALQNFQTAGIPAGEYDFSIIDAHCDALLAVIG